MIWVRPWPCLSSPRISCSCHCSSISLPCQSCLALHGALWEGGAVLQTDCADCLLADSSKTNSKQSLLQLPPPGLTVPLCSRAKCYKAVSGGTEFLLWLVPMVDQAPKQTAPPLSCQSPWSWVRLLRPSDVFELSQASSGIAGWCSSTWVSCSPASQLSTQKIKQSWKWEIGTCFCLMTACNSRGWCSSCLYAQTEMKRNRLVEGQLSMISQ